METSTVPLDTETGRPSAVVPSKSCTWPTGAAPEEVTVTLNAKSLLVEGNFVAGTAMEVCVAAFMVPPPPPPPPPQPSARLSAHASPRPNAARRRLRPPSPGKKKSNMAPNPVPALSIHQPFSCPPLVRFAGGIIAEAYSGRATGNLEAVNVLDGAATVTINTPGAGFASVTEIVSGM